MADGEGSIGLDNPRGMTDREQEILRETMLEFGQMVTWRSTFAAQWEEIASLIMPNYRNTFFYGSFNWPGEKKTQLQVDATGMMANKRFGAICDSLISPRNEIYQQLTAEPDMPYLLKDRATRLWYEQVTKILFKYRYHQMANFSAQNQANYQLLGAFGTMAMFVDAFDPSQHAYPVRGIRYRSIPLGELFLRENHQGMPDGCVRWFRMTAEQALQKFGKDGFPLALKSALEQKSQTLFSFLHRICPRTDYDPDRMDYMGKPFGSYYVSVEGKCVVGEGGYRMLPIIASRYDQGPQEVYGRGPANDVLPSLKTLNAQKRTFLKQGHRAADPVLLIGDDGIVDMNMRPGAQNKGGFTSDGKLLIGTVPTGNIQINEVMMQEERSLINDSFLVSLFQILTETPQMTATEVIERINEKGILIAPTMGRQQSEYLGPMTDRELDVLSAQGLLPPMPPRLREARGHYSIDYTGPLAKMAKAQRASGFFRTVEAVKELVNITGDSSLLDPFDFDTAVPEIADIQGVPQSWMADQQKIQRKREARAQAQAREQAIQAAPAQAAMIKARAVAAKAGQGAPVVPGAQAPAQGGPPLAQQLGG